MRSAKSIRAMGAVLMLFVGLAACRSGGGPASATPPGQGGQSGGAALLRPLDETHAAEFRQVFDEAIDRDRYIVALSPT